MAHTVDPVVVALIAALEATAHKKGKKSILKRIVSRLDEATAASLVASLGCSKPLEIDTSAKSISGKKAKSKIDAKSKRTAATKTSKSKSYSDAGVAAE